jgi:hypothetical protein
VLIFAAEMTIWAVLNQKGLGDQDFVRWRVWLLASVVITVFSGIHFYDLKAMEWVYAGALCALAHRGRFNNRLWLHSNEPAFFVDESGFLS